MPKAEQARTVDGAHKLLDKAIRRELWKPFVVGGAALTSFFVGHQLDSSHQAHADKLGVEYASGYDSLSSDAQGELSDAVSSGDLSDELGTVEAQEVAQLSDIYAEQQSEEHAGAPFTFVGQLASLYAGYKLVELGIARWFIRDKIRREHPENAPKRVSSQVDDLSQYGGWVEDDETTSDRFGLVPGQTTAFTREQLRRVGLDIESAEGVEPGESALREQALDMLNNAQWQNMIDGVSDNTTLHTQGDSEALRVRLLNDLWAPTETFTSLKSWYNYRRGQVVKPHSVHNLSENELDLPPVTKVRGGIGIAIARLMHHYNSYQQSTSGEGPEARNDLMLLIEGASLLDIIAPRKDGQHWYDYVETLSRTANSESRLGYALRVPQ